MFVSMLMLAALISGGETTAAGETPIPTLTLKEYQRLLEELVPDVKEGWQEVPWHLDLVAARAEASRSNKLLFLWTMNGHPLGCT